jgi:ornithine cyclodeaminase
VIELMPTSDGALYGFKYVNGHPEEHARRAADRDRLWRAGDVHRLSVLLTEMTILTALRTAATSAMAARHLAPKGARTMAMIGNGAQAEFQALAFKAVCGIDRGAALRHRPAATAKCARNLAGSGLTVTPCARPRRRWRARRSSPPAPPTSSMPRS